MKDLGEASYILRIYRSIEIDLKECLTYPNLGTQRQIKTLRVVQVILRPDITMEPYAQESMFWFILTHDN